MERLAHSRSSDDSRFDRSRRVICAGFAGLVTMVVVSACVSRDTGTTGATQVAGPPETLVAISTATTLSTLPASTTVPATRTPSSASSSTPAATIEASSAGTVVPEGFEEVAATVTAADGTLCELCLWLAATGEQRSQGLMFVTDLGGADGMAFRYESPHSGNFWMKNTVLPLSIAFYGPDGAFLDAFDMQPCTADPCPTYPTPDGFVVAIETYQGGLADLAIEPGSTLTLTDLPCL